MILSPPTSSGQILIILSPADSTNARHCCILRVIPPNLIIWISMSAPQAVLAVDVGSRTISTSRILDLPFTRAGIVFLRMILAEWSDQSART